MMNDELTLSQGITGLFGIFSSTESRKSFPVPRRYDFHLRQKQNSNVRKRKFKTDKRHKKGGLRQNNVKMCVFGTG